MKTRGRLDEGVTRRRGERARGRWGDWVSGRLGETEKLETEKLETEKLETEKLETEKIWKCENFGGSVIQNRKSKIENRKFSIS